MFSPYIIIFIISWVVAQGLKFVLQTKKEGRIRFKNLITESGGMPSSHSAVVVSLATFILFKEGINSAIFGLAFAFAMVVIYDSMKVRYSTGQQSIAINKIIDEENLNIDKLRVVKGHTPLEVAVGSSIGLLIGFSAFLLGF